ncbi:hypothetical protein MLD38_001516 [Melastoma candidum]|uniref:Uncharacterized protein n=1 Tax=Melastoma candidum TaxID=119954 RepID=A0ACB9SDK0_9MYRT|nr:hypothetical protein MLD38_001516 [Melastoma candidum]
MAFVSWVGNLLRQNASRHGHREPSSLGPVLFQAIRCMSSKLFIGGLSYATDDISLKETFSSYGEIIEARVIMDRETGRSKGFGFVSFTSQDEASSAMQDMDGKDLHGRRIRVNYAVEKSRGGFPGFQGGTGFRDNTSYSSGGYGGGSRYRDSSAHADYTDRRGGGYDGSRTRNFASSGGAGDVNFFTSGAEDEYTCKVHDDLAACHLPGGDLQPGDLEGENKTK